MATMKSIKWDVITTQPKKIGCHLVTIIAAVLLSQRQKDSNQIGK